MYLNESIQRTPNNTEKQQFKPVATASHHVKHRDTSVRRSIHFTE